MGERVACAFVEPAQMLPQERLKKCTVLTFLCLAIFMPRNLTFKLYTRGASEDHRREFVPFHMCVKGYLVFTSSVLSDIARKRFILAMLGMM